MKPPSKNKYRVIEKLRANLNRVFSMFGVLFLHSFGSTNLEFQEFEE